MLSIFVWLIVAAGPAQRGSITQPATLPPTFAKTFVGRIGDRYQVRMQLERKSTALSGRYSYLDVSESLLGLSGTIDSAGAFTLTESDAGTRTGSFRGTLSLQTGKGPHLLKLSGTWSSADGRRTLPFEMLEEHLELDGEVIVYSTALIDDDNKKLGYEIGAAYPQFEGGRAGAVQKLNAEIKALVSRQAAEFRKQAKEWMQENRPRGRSAGDPPEASQLSVSYDVLAAAHGVVSLRFSGFTYFPGTAHPSHDHEVFTYSLRDGRALALEDLFKPGSAYLKTLSEYCIEELGLDDEWRQGAAPKRENFARWNITRNGLLITFGEYQVAPYVAGMPEVVIPFGELADVLRNDGPLAPFTKR